jgi:hypothetical protein
MGVVSRRLIVSGIPSGRAVSWTWLVCDGDGDAKAKLEKYESKRTAMAIDFFMSVPPNPKMLHDPSPKGRLFPF